MARDVKVRIATPAAGERVTPDDARCLRSRWMVLAPGEAVGEHSTDNKEEVLVLIEGTARIEAGGEVHSAVAPASVFIPAQTRHNVVNTGDGPLVYIYITGKLPVA